MKSWSDRLDNPRPRQVKPAPMDIAGIKKSEIVLVPTAGIVDAFIRTLAKGTSIDAQTPRAKLAQR